MVVVRIMVPFLVLSIIRHLARQGTIILTTTHIEIIGNLWGRWFW